MMDWFRAGGFGMFMVLIIGAGAIGYGLKAAKSPTAGAIATLRSLATLVGLSALFSFGTNLWAVNVHLSDDAFLKSQSIAAADKAFVALIGFTEAAQTLTLGGLLAMVAVGLRVVAEARLERAAKE